MTEGNFVDYVKLFVRSGNGGKGSTHLHREKYIDNLQNIVTEFMKSNAYSVGISDLIANNTTKEKINKYTPKTHIPIYDVNYYRNNIPDYTFLFAWNHKDEIFKKEKNILKKTKWFAHINF